MPRAPEVLVPWQPNRSASHGSQACGYCCWRTSTPTRRRLLRASGHEVESLPGALEEAELADALADVDLLGIRSGTNVTEKVLDAAPRLQAVGAFCIGTNQIDLDSATGHGVAVFNAPYSNTRSVVEIAIGSIIALARRLMEKNTAMHAGVWDKSAKGSHEIRGRRLGIVGYGNIGSQAVGGGRGAGHVGVLLRHRGPAGAGQREALRQPARAAGDRRGRVAARRRPLGQPRPVRRGRVRRHAPAVAVHEHEPRLRRRHGVAAAAHRVGPRRGRGHRRLPLRAEAPGRRVRVRPARPAERHPHPARGRQHRGGPAGHRPLRRRQACAATPTAGRPRCRSTCRRSARATWPARTGWRTCTATCPACWRR
nr:NAD(P)-dependent oxidoreductase [Angustibacter aerolatus]